MNNKFPVYDILPTGRGAAISLDTLQNIFDLDSRGVRAEISRERAAGAPILSSTVPPGGYYRAADAEELRRFAASMESRARNINKAAMVARQELEAMSE